MDKVYAGDSVLLNDGRTLLVTDVPEGNEDAPEDLIIVTDGNQNLFVINPFRVDKVIAKA